MIRYSLIAAISFAGILLVAAACNFGSDSGVDIDDVDCISDGECDGNAFCVDEECVECGRDSHCSSGVCLEEENRCVTCEFDAHCSGSDVCIEFQCLQCGTDGDCSGNDVCAPNNRCVECNDDSNCPDGVCHQEECRECTSDDHCGGDDVCSGFECISGCTSFDCGPGGTCVDDDSSISCECDDGFVLGDDGTCDSCVCDIENGTGECDGGTCFIDECDPGYSTEDDDPDTGCECGPDDTPDPVNFIDGNCDGLDGNMSTAIFVSTFGDDTDDGRPLRPVRSITRGIELAADDAERDNVFIAEGIYEEVVEVNDNINLYGGYRDEGDGSWSRGPDFETVISGEDVSLGQRPLIVEHVTGDIELQLLTVISAPALVSDFYREAPGEPLISHAGSAVGIYLGHNTGHVDISHVDVEAKRGMNGADGADGNTGSSGRDGDDATGVDAAEQNFGTSSGLSCDYSEERNAPGRQGGDGGTGRNAGASGGTITNTSPHTFGGAGGDYYDVGACGTDDQTGDDGDDGDDGTPGDDGDNADGIDSDARILAGVELSVVYLGESGEDAAPGEPGTSGAGGGGGGGSKPGLCADMEGGGGGAGGLGGCGGQGGTGGESGGASIGILVYSSSVSVSDSFIRTGTGGDGGDGGTGGLGGEGGEGGAGADGEEHDPIQGDHGVAGHDAGDGGDGGDAGDGGNGGNAGGGEGGASVGILHKDSTVNTSNLDFDIGRGGEGGAGGAGDPDEGFTGPDGPDGPDGLEGEVLEF